MFVADEDRTGVIPVSLAATEKYQTVQGGFISERTVCGLKYQPPSLDTLHLATLSPAPMVHKLNELLDKETLSDLDREYWDRLYANTIDANSATELAKDTEDQLGNNVDATVRNNNETG